MAAGPETLAGDFAEATEEQWRGAVDKVLRGGPFERLVSRTADGIEVQPLYTDGPDETATGTPGAAPFTRGFHPAARDEGRWDLRAVIDGDDPARNAELARRELERGATSLLLAGGALADRAAFDASLEGVLLDMAPVALQPGAAFLETTEWLLARWMDGAVPDGAARGCLGADPIGTLARTGELPQGIERALADLAGLASMAAGRLPGVRAVTVDATPWSEAGGSEAQELAAMLCTAAAYLRAMERAGMSAPGAAGQFELVLGADVDLFTTVAKLRAARRLWSAMAAACGIDTTLAAPTLSVRTLRRSLSRRDPWVNLLRVTTAAFAAVVGGADTVLTAPFDAALGTPGELGRRMARNTQLLLGEESGIGRVVDPAGGSWYVESLTEDLVAAAWEQFKALEAAGGMPAVLLDGLLADRVAEVRERRRHDVATRRAPLTGVSEFPDPLEEPVPTAAASSGRVMSVPTSERATGCAPLPSIRWAEPFEALRDAADAAGRPTIFLANLGPASVHTARAGFARNLFGAGGLLATGGEVGDTDGFDTPEAAAAAFAASGTPLVCICSSDERYAEQAAEVARALKAAGATRVYLAGKPGEAADELRAAGVDEFVHVGVEVTEVLEGAHRALGIAGAPAVEAS